MTVELLFVLLALVFFLCGAFGVKAVVGWDALAKAMLTAALLAHLKGWS